MLTIEIEVALRCRAGSVLAEVILCAVLHREMLPLWWVWRGSPGARASPEDQFCSTKVGFSASRAVSPPCWSCLSQASLGPVSHGGVSRSPGCEAQAGQQDPGAAVVNFPRIWIRLERYTVPVHLCRGLFHARLCLCC